MERPERLVSTHRTLPNEMFALVLRPGALVVWGCLLLVGPSWAQVNTLNEYRGQPEVWHMDRPADPGVDAYGDLSLSLPVMTVPGRGLDFDISFSYRAGITPTQKPGWIGLGWSFDPGSISRDPEGGVNYYSEAGRTRYGVDVFDDTSFARALPDVYHITLPGRGTFEAIQINNRDFRRAMVPAVGYDDFVTTEHTPWRIEAAPKQIVTVGYLNENAVMRTQQTGEQRANAASQGVVPAADYPRFIVTTEDGTRYVFEKPTLSFYDTVTETMYTPEMYRQVYVNAWRVVAILGPDYTKPVPADLTGWPADSEPGSWVRVEYDVVRGYVDSWDLEVFMSTYVKEIHTPTHKAVFTTEQRYDPGYNPMAPVLQTTHLDRRLVRIDLVNKASNVTVQTVELVQPENRGVNGAGFGPRSESSLPQAYRLRLDEIRFKGVGGVARNGYRFYYDYNPRENYDQLRNCRDDLGYFRDYAVCTAARLDPKGGAAWNLTRIVHPSGAVDSLVYETDQVDDRELPYYTSLGSTEDTYYVVHPTDGPNPMRVRQGGSRLIEHYRWDGMGNLLKTTYGYGHGRLTGIPIGPWLHHGTSFRIFLPSNRGKIAVVYEYVDRKVWDGNTLIGTTRTLYSKGATERPIVHATEVWQGVTDLVVMQRNASWAWGRPVGVLQLLSNGRTVQEVQRDCRIVEDLQPWHLLAHVWTANGPNSPQLHVRLGTFYCEAERTYEYGSDGTEPRTLAREVRYLYDNKTAQLVTTAETGDRFNRMTTLTRAFTVYDSLLARNMLSQIAREDVFEWDRSNGVKTLVRATVTTWKSYGSLRLWKPHQIYRWLDVDGSRTAPSDHALWFGSTSSHPEWQLSTTHADYDVHGNPTTILDARGFATTLTYDSPAQAYLTKASRGGLSVQLGYDAVHAKVNRITSETGEVLKFGYDRFGRLARVEDENGRLLDRHAYFEYENDVRPNRTKSVRYHSSADSVVTWVLSDGLGRTIQTHLVVSNILAVATTTVYDGAGRQEKVYKPYGFDPRGSRPPGTFQADYDAKARSLYGCSAPYVATAYYPDPLARVARTTAECATRSVRTSYEIDEGHLSTVTTDEDGRRSRTGTDLLGRTVKRVGAEGTIGATTRFVYRATDELREVIDPEGRHTLYAYNTLGQLVTKTTPDAGTTSYLYDEAGNLRFIQDANGAAPAGPWRFLYNKYDEHNRIVESGVYVGDTTFAQAASRVKDQSWPSRNTDRVTRYVYDAYPVQLPAAIAGRVETRYPKAHLTQVWFEGGHYWYFYDRRGRVVDRYVYLDALREGKLIEYEYDLQGNVTQVRYQDGADDAYYFWYTYDDAGRLEEIRSDASAFGVTAKIEASYRYTAAGQVERMRLGTTANGQPVQEVDYRYHVRGWLSGINNVAAMGSDKFAMQLAYDAPLFSGAAAYHTGNVAAVEWKTVTTTNATMPGRYAYFYDDLNRLERADFQQFAGGAWQNTSPVYDVGKIEYDKSGNILALPRHNGGQQEKLAASSYRYYPGTNKVWEVALQNIDNASAGTQTVVFAYDANGNATRARGMSDIRYDQRNLPYRLTGPRGETLNYLYDADGQRIATGREGKYDTFYIRGIDGSVQAVYDADRLLYWNIVSGGTVIGRIDASYDAPTP